jgi:hypothetical protein
MTSRTTTSSSPIQPRLGTIVGVGIAFAILQTFLIATFPILSGSELRSHLQGMAVTALEFPLGSVQPLVFAVAGSRGAAPFLLGLGLTFLNGALWTTALLSLRRRMREGRA